MENESFCLGVTAAEDDIPFANVQLGAFFLGDNIEESAIVDYCTVLAKSKKSGKLLVLTCGSESKVKVYDIKTKKLGECNHEFCDHHKALTNVVQVSLSTVFSIKFTFYKEKLEETLTNLFNELKQSFKDASFSLNGSKFELSALDELTVEDLYSQIESFDEIADIQIPANMKKKLIEKNQKNMRSKKETLEFTFKIKDAKQEDPTPIELIDGKLIEFDLPVIVFYNLQLQDNLGFLYRVFEASIKRLLCELQAKLNLDQTTLSSLPRVCNFYDPANYSHFINTILGQTDYEEAFLKQRESLHHKYLIPTTRPTFKIVNTFKFRLQKESRLANVHLGLISGIKNGQCAVVSGNYLYYHYNQDQTSDSGWGCAYRSLQTIISWFQLQGYIDIDTMPTHKQIQQALVDVGDKEPNFVGSSKWIGSQEVCYVLSHLFAIDSKIIFISSGAELANKARELILHFNTNGTPIMIGGGVLAHTIIGVDFDENSGDIKFLVLDPHYVGDEDLSVIHKKGWCGWKPLSFWDKNSFYNLCLPQKPAKF